MQPLSMLPAHFGPQTPSPMSAPLQIGKRPYPFEATGSYPVGREIRPKPTSGGSAYGPVSPIDNPPRKKRGRPTKAEAQAKAEAFGVSTQPVSVPRLESGGLSSFATPTSATVPDAPPTYQPPSEEQRAALPPVTRLPVSAMLTPTAPQTTSQSSSSSGKRRRGRSTRSDPEDFQAVEAARASRSEEYESPYARVAPTSQATPARAAELRYREEFEQQPEQPTTTQPGTQAPPLSCPRDPNIQ